MNLLKQILTYSMWAVVALICGIIYMRIVLGPPPKPSTGFMQMFDWGYEVAMIHVGSILGSIIATVFVLIDIFYLKKKLENKPKGILIRFLIIVALTSTIGTIHYLLENVIDVI